MTIEKQPFARYTISTPTPDLQSLTKTCVELKQAVEQMMGRYNEPGGRAAARVAILKDQPQNLHDGDFWLSIGTSNTLSVQLNGKWYKVADLVP